MKYSFFYRILFLALLLTTGTVSYEGVPSCLAETSSENNALRQLYDSQKYQEVLSELQKSGFKDASDFYNAGNIYFRLGKNAHAYSYYLKANQLDAGNSDIEYNLELARENMEKAGIDSHTTFIIDFLVPFASKISWPFYLLFLCVLNLGFGYVLLQKRKSTLYGIVILWCLTISSGLGLSYLKQIKLAASLGEPTVVRSGPKDSFSEIAKINPGTKIELMGEKREGWVQIRFSLGNLGWVMEKDLLEI